MLLGPKYGRKYCRRERAQGRQLSRGLFRVRKYQEKYPFRQTMWGSPVPSIKDQQLHFLRWDAGGYLNAHHPFARSMWFRALGGNLCRQLGIQPPSFAGPGSIYWVTLTDRTVECSDGVFMLDGSDPPGMTMNRIVAHYGDMLKGLNFIGMIDPALYVSTYRTHQVSSFIHYHAHAFVWGAKRAEIADRCDAINAEVKALLPYGQAAKWDPITRPTLLNVLSYMTKMPRNQYQLKAHEKRASYRQYKGQISGLNAVRLFEEMSSYSLDQLTMAGGEGRRVLRRSLADLEDWRSERMSPPQKVIYQRI